jgi:undecaprenyl-diphosphatase
VTASITVNGVADTPAIAAKAEFGSSVPQVSRFESRKMRGRWQKYAIAPETRLQVRHLPLILIIAALLFAFGLIAQEVVEGEALALDRMVLLAFRQVGNPAVTIGPPWLQEGARDVTALGSTIVLGIILFAVVGYLFLVHKRAEGWLMLGAVVGGVALNDILKFGFARPRPDLVTHAVRVFTTSFPSGHATLSAITYLTLGALLAQTHSSRPIRVYFIGVATLLTVLVGLSRVYLGVHYPSDVLAGWCIGTAWAMAWWAVMTWLQRRGQLESAAPT